MTASAIALVVCLIAVYGRPAAAASGVCGTDFVTVETVSASFISQATVHLVNAPDPDSVTLALSAGGNVFPGAVYDATIASDVSIGVNCPVFGEGAPYSYTLTVTPAPNNADPLVVGAAAALAATLFYGQYGTLLAGLLALIGIVTIPLLVVRFGVRRILDALRKMMSVSAG